MASPYCARSPFSTGGDPLSAPIVGADGNLYGTTSLGGPDGGGVLYRIRLAPEVSVSGPHSIQEGASVTLTATGSDPQGLPVSYAWDLDGDGQFDDATGASAAFSANHRDRDGDGTYPVSVRATDVTGLFAVANTTVTVSNVAPTVSLAPAARGSPAARVGTLTVTFADPGPDTWTVRIEYGDGAFEERSPTSPGAVAFAHSWSNPGRYTVRVTVTDDDGGVGFGCGSPSRSADRRTRSGS